MKTKHAVWLVISVFFAITWCAVCQVTNSPIIPPPAPEKIVAFQRFISPWQFILVPIVLVIVQFFKHVIPNVPAAVWPYASPVVGALLDWIAIEAGWWTGNPTIGAMLGGLSSWFYTAIKPTGLLSSSSDLAKPVVGTSNPS